MRRISMIVSLSCLLAVPATASVDDVYGTTELGFNSLGGFLGYLNPSDHRDHLRDLDAVGNVGRRVRPICSLAPLPIVGLGSEFESCEEHVGHPFT